MAEKLCDLSKMEGGIKLDYANAQYVLGTENNAQPAITSSGLTYTATSDGVLFLNIRIGRDSNVLVYVDNKDFANIYTADITNGNTNTNSPIFSTQPMILKAGQSVDIKMPYGSYAWLYSAFFATYA